MKFIYWLKDLKGRIKYHPNHLHIKTLKRGWVDCDHQMLHACMQILVNFVENEKVDGIVDWEYDEDIRHAGQTMNRLYDWWKHDPFAHDATIMPPGSDWLYQYDIKNHPLEAIEDWIDEIYNRDSENMKWAKQIIRKFKVGFRKRNKDEHKEDYNEHRYYMCLNYIELAATERQNNALKDLVSVRGYMWT